MRPEQPSDAAERMSCNAQHDEESMAITDHHAIACAPRSSRSSTAAITSSAKSRSSGVTATSRTKRPSESRQNTVRRATLGEKSRCALAAALYVGTLSISMEFSKKCQRKKLMSNGKNMKDLLMNAKNYLKRKIYR